MNNRHQLPVKKQLCNRIPLLCVSFMFLITSCQTVLKTALGLKDFESEISNSKRLAYYDPFVRSEVENLQLYAVADSVKLKIALFNFKNFPHIVAEDLLNQKFYRINCYDDMEGFITNINKGELQLLKEISSETFNETKSHFDSNQIQYSRAKPKNSSRKKWDIYLVSGTFLGKKLRDRTLPITDLQNIDNLSILDLSINAPESIK